VIDLKLISIISLLSLPTSHPAFSSSFFLLLLSSVKCLLAISITLCRLVNMFPLNSVRFTLISFGLLYNFSTILCFENTEFPSGNGTFFSYSDFYSEVKHKDYNLYSTLNMKWKVLSLYLSASSGRTKLVSLELNSSCC